MLRLFFAKTAYVCVETHLVLAKVHNREEHPTAIYCIKIEPVKYSCFVKERANSVN